MNDHFELPKDVTSFQIYHHLMPLVLEGGLSILLIGPTGCGKTYFLLRCRDYINRKLNEVGVKSFGAVVLNGPAIDPVSIEGIPWMIATPNGLHPSVIRESNLTDLISADKEIKTGISDKNKLVNVPLFIGIDEIGSATENVQAGFLYLSIQKIAEYKFSHPLSIVATANPPSTKHELSNRLALPLRRRFISIPIPSGSRQTAMAFLRKLASGEDLDDIENYITDEEINKIMSYSKEDLKLWEILWRLVVLSFQSQMSNGKDFDVVLHDADMLQANVGEDGGDGIDSPGSREQMIRALAIACASHAPNWFLNMIIRGSIGTNRGKAFVETDIVKNILSRSIEDRYNLIVNLMGRLMYSLERGRGSMQISML